MTIRSGFFQSIGGDRRYRAEFFASYFASFIGNGVFPNPSTNLQVISDVNMNVNVSAGKGWINGYYLVNDSNYLITIPTADGVLSRIDRIVFALDFNTREMNIYNKRGTPSANPTPPNLIRDANIYELALADISIPAGTTSLSQTNITDVRLNAQLCGIVSGLINQVDTTTLFIQYQQQFQDFLQDLENALDGDVAGNLLNLINNLDDRFSSHEQLRASVSQFGHTRLNNTVTSTSINEAATSNAVKIAYDRAELAFQSASNGKQLLSVAIAGKGQTVSSTATFNEFATAINNIQQGYYAEGTLEAGSILQFASVNGSTFSLRSGQVNLNFRPKIIQLFKVINNFTIGQSLYFEPSGNSVVDGVTVEMKTNTSGVQQTQYNISITGNAYVNETGFRLPLVQEGTYTWRAWG